MQDHGGSTHRYTEPLYFVHTVFQFIPPAEFFATHPEYFSLVNGQRTKDQVCYSNANVRAILRERVSKAFEDAGGRGLISLSHEDNHIVCECESCRAIDTRHKARGASIIATVAEVARYVKDRYPEARVSTLAYSSTSEPPQGLELPDNLVVVWAPFHGIVESQLRGWTDISSELWVWYYPNGYTGPLPEGTLEKIAKDFRLFHGLGVQGYSPIEQTAPGVYDAMRLVDLQNWVLMKLMWDPHRSVSDLVDDFTKHYYGDAASHLRRYFLDLEKNAASENISAKSIRRYQLLFDEAEKAVASDAQSLARVKVARLGLDRATVLHWDEVIAERGPKLRYDDIADRFKANYMLSLERIPASKREMILNSPTDAGVLQGPYLGLGFLDEYKTVWDAVAKKPKYPPLHPTKAKPAQVHTILAVDDSHVQRQRYNEWLEFVPNSAAPSGMTARMDSASFQMGYWDTDRTYGLRALNPGEIQQNRYELYYLDRVLLKPGAMVFFDVTWHMQFQNITKWIDPANPGQWWDVWASVRFEGPAYDPQAAPGNVNRYFVDRIELVKLD